MTRTPEILADGLFFPEGPRWRTAGMLAAAAADSAGEGRLFYSDILGKKVMSLGLDGSLEEIAEVPGMPSGLGWLPDGTLIVVSVMDGKLMAVRRGGLEEIADMMAVTGNLCNDMVVDAGGGAYIGSPAGGWDESKIPNPGNMQGFGSVVLVGQDGDRFESRIVADRVTCPNGACITPDGKTLIFAESIGFRLTAFDIAEDGSLVNRRPWADLGAPPDGICMDEEGCLWVALCYFEYGGPGGYVRVREGGEIADRIDLEGYSAYACTLGGSEMRTLFLCESKVLGQERFPGDGRIRAVDVDVPGSGSP